MIVAIGLLAGALTTGAWLPQLIKTWRLGRADEVSGAYLFTFGSGIVIWLVYGIIAGQVAVLVANAVTLALVSSLIVMKLRQDSAMAAEAEAAAVEPLALAPTP